VIADQTGYWVTSVIQRRYSSIDGGLAIFLLARLWRLYPAFLIAVFVSAYFHPDGLVSLSLANLSLVSQDSHAKYMQVVWSLVVEVQFYIIAPLLALVIRNDKPSSKFVEDIEDYRAFEAAVIANYNAQTAVERELVLRLVSL
jgi:peptidoglycan/LPS O-acetylase OafA/YrhL